MEEGRSEGGIEERTVSGYENYGKDCLLGKPPPCACACPLRLDARGLAGLAARGNFKAAYRLFRDQALFPGIVSRICEAPCGEACVRSALDEGVDMPAIERAVVDYAGAEAPPRYSLPRKEERIAVVGGGLAGLACAHRLGMKNYEVTLYEQCGSLGGSLHGRLDPARFLPEIESQMRHSNVRYEMGRRQNSIEPLLSGGWSAVLIATGAGGDDFGLRKGLDERSFGTFRAGAFLAGAILGAKPAESLRQGIVAAYSIEKYVKTGMMDGVPESFAGGKSEIAADLAGVAPVPRLKAAEGSAYSREEAALEASRCLKCDCGLCGAACELFAFFAKKPRQIASEAFMSMHAGRGSITKQAANHLISSCNLCGLCGKVCPKGIDIGRLSHDFRHFRAREGKYPQAYSDFYLRDMAFSDGEAALALPPPGGGKASWMFFPGCQLGASNPLWVERAYAFLLRRLGGGALLLRCCGAPADWGAEEALREASAREIERRWEAFGRPGVICACPACMRHFARFLPQIPCRSLYEVIAEAGLPDERDEGRRSEAGLPVSVFDPCASRDFPGMQESVREILSLLGLKNEELSYSGEKARCCGIGAHVLGSNPKLVGEMVENRIGENGNPYVSYCSNCGDAFALWGKECHHILSLVFGTGAVGGGAQAPPALSERRRNKLRIKNRLLAGFGGDPPPEEEEGAGIRMEIPPGLLVKMNKSLILEEDAREAIRYCEENDCRVHDPAADSYSGHLRIGMTTLWVEYAKRDGVFELRKVYAHRMRILGEGRDA